MKVREWMVSERHTRSQIRICVSGKTDRKTFQYWSDFGLPNPDIHDNVVTAYYVAFGMTDFKAKVPECVLDCEVDEVNYSKDEYSGNLIVHVYSYGDLSKIAKEMNEKRMAK